jgi:hypothetical protein
MDFVVATAMVALLSSAASAGIISDPPAPTVSGPGLGFAQVVAVVTGAPNNDNVPAAGVPDNNIAVPFKRFDHADYIDIQFTVVPSGGVTEYQVSEFVDNNTGLPWTNYNMMLGHGTGAGFVISPLGDGLDFDFPNYDTPPASSAFPIVLTPDEDHLIYTGGVHGTGAQTYTLRIDVPDFSPSGGPTTFTLRQFPTAVPEPSAFALAALALISLVVRRRA